MTPIAARCRFLLTGAATVAATALLAAPATASVAPAGTGLPRDPGRAAVRAVGRQRRLLPRSRRRLRAGRRGLDASWTGRSRPGQRAVVPQRRRRRREPAPRGRQLRHDRARSASASSTARCASSRTPRASSTLNVDALVEGPGASQRAVRIATVEGAGQWAASDVVPMVVNELAAEHGNAIDVRLRFTPQGSGTWSIDDVYVDPYRVASSGVPRRRDGGRGSHAPGAMIRARCRPPSPAAPGADRPAAQRCDARHHRHAGGSPRRAGAARALRPRDARAAAHGGRLVRPRAGADRRRHRPPAVRLDRRPAARPRARRADRPRHARAAGAGGAAAPARAR